MAIIIRLLSDSEKDLANNFFNGIYKTNRLLKDFEWEFFNAPAGKAIYVIAVDESITSHTKIVGIQCAIPIELISSGGTKVLTAKSEDTLVDPAFRGQKIFERMYELLFEECRKAGIKYIWGFTPANKAFERLGFGIPFKTEQALLVFRPLAAYSYLKNLNPRNSLTDKIKIFGLTILSWLTGLKRFFVSSATIPETPIEAKSDLFGHAYSGQQYFTIHETDAYLSWRLKNNPFQNSYKNFQSSNATFDALLNFREDVAYIERTIYKPGMPVKPYLKSLIKIFQKHQVSLVRAFCFSSNKVLEEQGEELTRVGFTYLKRGSYFVWKSLDDTNEINASKLIINRLFTQGNL